MKNSIEVNVGDLTNQLIVTVHIKKLNRFKFRFWLMEKLLLLAAWVAPVEMEIVSE